MAISLDKGGMVNLTKMNDQLRRVLVGLGWQANSGGGPEFDLDASAFLLARNGKVRNDNDFIFYGNLNQNEDMEDLLGLGVIHMGDNLVGGTGQQDDEQMKVNLTAVPASVERIVFTVTIYNYDKYGQNFGQVSNAYIRVVDDESGQELVHYDLTEDYSTKTAIVAGELSREGNGWKFTAVGTGYENGLRELCLNYGVNVR